MHTRPDHWQSDSQSSVAERIICDHILWVIKCFLLWIPDIHMQIVCISYTCTTVHVYTCGLTLHVKYVLELQKSSLNYFPRNQLSVMAMVVTIMPFGRTISWHSLYIDACEAMPPEMCFGNIFGCRVLLFLIVRQVSNCTPKPCNTQADF